jgi:hypothetical protein
VCEWVFTSRDDERCTRTPSRTISLSGRLRVGEDDNYVWRLILKGDLAWQTRGGRQSNFASEARNAREEISAQERGGQLREGEAAVTSGEAEAEEWEQSGWSDQVDF